jgi:hypothetical protein
MTMSVLDSRDSFDEEAYANALKRTLGANDVRIKSVTEIGASYQSGSDRRLQGNGLIVDTEVVVDRRSKQTVMDKVVDERFPRALASEMVEEGAEVAGQHFIVDTFDDSPATPSPTPVTSTPLLFSQTVTAMHVEQASPTNLFPEVLIQDEDSIQLQGARVTLQLPSIEDKLNISKHVESIQVTWDQSEGRLSLNGNASVAEYQDALRHVAYTNLASYPSERTRTIITTVTDGVWVSSSLRTWVFVRRNNERPVLQNVQKSARYVEKDTAVAFLLPIVSIYDQENMSSPFMQSADITIAEHFEQGSDELYMVNDKLPTSVQTKWDAAAGVLSLSGVALTSEYEMLLKQIAFKSLSDNPSVAFRMISVTISDGQDYSPVEMVRVRVIATNDKPSIATAEPSAYIGGSHDLKVFSNLTIYDPDTVNLTSARIKITQGYELGGDRLSVMIANGCVLTQSSSKLELLISGSASLAAYQSMLRSVGFSSSKDEHSISDTQRTVTVEVDDGSGYSTSNIARVFVPVFAKVNIVLHPQPQANVSAGSTYSISVHATGTAPLFYRWSRFSSPFPDANELQWQDGIDRTGRVLTIKGALFGYDEGYYRCFVSNEASVSQSSASHISIMHGVPTWITFKSKRKTISPQILVQNEEMIMLGWQPPALNGYSSILEHDVQFKKGDGSWQNVNSTMPETAALEIIRNDDAHIKLSAQELAFRVRVQNSKGWSTFSDSLEGVLASPTAPAWLRELRASADGSSVLGPDISTDPQKTLTMNAQAAGTPPPTYRWFKNGRPISGADTSELTIANTNPDAHDGIYSVEASNYLGTIVSEALNVKINTSPSEVRLTQLSPASNERPRAGAEIVLTCSAISSPSPSYIWRKDGMKLSNSEGMVISGSGDRLIIHQVSKMNEGFYTCVARNSACAHLEAISAQNCKESAQFQLQIASCTKGEYRDLLGHCLLCSRGFFQSRASHTDTSCTRCTIGQHQDASGSSACALCSAGKFAASTATSLCKECSAGKMMKQPGASVCTECSSGQYTAQTGQLACVDCEIGLFQPQMGQKACTACMPGLYSSGGAATCTECTIGKFGNSTAASTCFQCAAGLYQDETGRTSCKACQHNSYNPLIGMGSSSNCMSCPASTATKERGAIALNACVCAAGTYNSNLAGTDQSPTCIPCPVGANCTALGVTLLTMESSSGYYRPPWGMTTAEFWRCHGDRNDCAGGASSSAALEASTLEAARVVERGALVADGDQFQCAKANTGVLCSQCRPGYQRTDGVKCESCNFHTSNGKRSLVPMSILVAFTLFGLVLWFITHSNRIDSVPEKVQADKENTAEPQVGVLTRRAKQRSLQDKGCTQNSFQGILKIMITWGQLMGSFHTTFSIPWPTTFQQQIDAIGGVFNLDVLSPWSLSCDIDTSFFARYRVQVLLLPFIAALACMAYCCAAVSIRNMPDVERQLRLRNFWTRSVQLMLGTIYIMYPSLCAHVFVALNCNSFRGREFLATDLTHECWTGQHLTYANLSSCLVVFYVLGIPLVIFIVLYRNRKRIQQNPDDKELKALYGSLYSQYEPRYWYFEIVQMLRKMVLTGVLVLVVDGSSTQVAFGMLVCFSYLVLFINLVPFVNDADDRLEQVTTVQLFLVLLVGLILNLDDEKKNLERQLEEVAPHAVATTTTNTTPEYILNTMTIVVLVCAGYAIVIAMLRLRKLHRAQEAQKNAEEQAALKRNLEEQPTSKGSGARPVVKDVIIDTRSTRGPPLSRAQRIDDLVSSQKVSRNLKRNIRGPSLSSRNQVAPRRLPQQHSTSGEGEKAGVIDLAEDALIRPLIVHRGIKGPGRNQVVPQKLVAQHVQATNDLQHDLERERERKQARLSERANRRKAERTASERRLIDQQVEEAGAVDSKEEQDEADATKAAADVEPTTAPSELAEDEADAKLIAPHHQVQQFLEEAGAVDSKEEKDEAGSTKDAKEGGLELVDVEDMNI